MEKEECKGRERSGRAEAKLSFLKKFFPDAITTPVGTCKLWRREVQATDIIECDTGSGQGKATHLQTFSSSHFTEKRKSESSHTSSNILISSPSKKLRTKFRNNLNFWETRKLTGSDYLAGPDRGLVQDMEE